MKIVGLEKEAIKDALTSGTVTVGVDGLEKMGLPLAAVFAERGARVIGVDVDQKRVNGITEGHHHPIPLQEPSYLLYSLQFSIVPGQSHVPIINGLL